MSNNNKTNLINYEQNQTNGNDWIVINKKNTNYNRKNYNNEHYKTNDHNNNGNYNNKYYKTNDHNNRYYNNNNRNFNNRNNYVSNVKNGHNDNNRYYETKNYKNAGYNNNRNNNTFNNKSNNYPNTRFNNLQHASQFTSNTNVNFKNNIYKGNNRNNTYKGNNRNNTYNGNNTYNKNNRIYTSSEYKQLKELKFAIKKKFMTDDVSTMTYETYKSFVTEINDKYEDDMLGEIINEGIYYLIYYSSEYSNLFEIIEKMFDVTNTDKLLPEKKVGKLASKRSLFCALFHHKTENEKKGSNERAKQIIKFLLDKNYDIYQKNFKGETGLGSLISWRKLKLENITNLNERSSISDDMDYRYRAIFDQLSESNIYVIIKNVANKFINDFTTAEKLQKNMEFIEILRVHIILKPEFTLKMIINYIFEANKKTKTLLSKGTYDEETSKSIKFILLSIKNIDNNFQGEKTYFKDLRHFFKLYLDNTKKLSFLKIKELVHKEIKNANLKKAINNSMSKLEIEEIEDLNHRAEQCKAMTYVEFCKQFEYQKEKKYDTVCELIQENINSNTNNSMSIAIRCIIQIQCFEKTKEYIWTLLETRKLSSKMRYLLVEYLCLVDENKLTSEESEKIDKFRKNNHVQGQIDHKLASDINETNNSEYIKSVLLDKEMKKSLSEFRLENIDDDEIIEEIEYEIDALSNNYQDQNICDKIIAELVNDFKLLDKSYELYVDNVLKFLKKRYEFEIIKNATNENNKYFKIHGDCPPVQINKFRQRHQYIISAVE